MNNITYLRFEFFLLLFVACFAVNASISAQSNNSKIIKVSNQTFDLLQEVKKLSGGNASIYLTITTHQDLAWCNSIEKCKIDRDTLWLSPFIKTLRENPSFQMDVEQSSIIKEYINRHPDQKDTVLKYMNEGRMLVGAAFTQSYEDMYSDESLARQFYYGKKWLKDNFKNYNSTVYYNSDVPGRTLQMPQLMAKSGVDGMFFSRFERGLFNWYSPDGSFVTGYSPGHYIDFYTVLAKDDTAALRTMAEQVIYWLKNFNNKATGKKAIPAMLNYEFMWDQKPVKNLHPFVNFWNSISTVENESGEKLNITLPPFHFATFDKFIKDVKASSTIPEIIGERPNEWIYIHGPSHHWALSASRKADILLPAAEKFWSSNEMIDNSGSYPSEEFGQAWESKIYPDHGWGGKEGQSTDDTFLEKFEEAKQKGNSLLNGAMQKIASNIKTNKSKGVPVVVFNSLSWNRSDVVTIDTKLPFKSKAVAVFSGNGKMLASQVSNAVLNKDGFLGRVKITFIAESVPSIGYSTYYLRPATQEAAEQKPAAATEFENAFYKLSFGNGGIEKLIDKASGKSIFSNDALKAGDVFTLKSVGNGAGEFDAIQQPSMEGFDRTGNYKTTWSQTEDGPLYVVFKYRQPIRDAVVEQFIKVYKTIKRIDFDVALKNWDGTLYREYRMALPLNITNAKVSYEVPYGVVEIGKDELKQPAGQIYQTIPSKIHPRGLENWMSASGNDFGITMSSSVAAFDFIDMTGMAPNSTLLQPILLASRRSCHNEGNEYTQTGDHYYSFSLTTHAPGWKNGFHFGRQANEPLQAVVNPTQAADASLGENGSFVTLDKENVVLTTMKMAEDGHGFVLRLFELEGRDTNVELQFKRNLTNAYKTNLIEEVSGNIPVSGNRLQFIIGHNSIETIKVNW